jgi:hypothetical protein
MWAWGYVSCHPHHDPTQWEAQVCRAHSLSQLLTPFFHDSVSLLLWLHSLLHKPSWTVPSLSCDMALSGRLVALPFLTMCFICMGFYSFSCVIGIKWEFHHQGNQKWERIQFQPCPGAQMHLVSSHCVLSFLVFLSQNSAKDSWSLLFIFSLVLTSKQA